MSVSNSANSVQPRPQLAVVGMSALFPRALNVEEFWANSIAGIQAFRKAPEDRIPSVFVNSEAVEAEGVYGNIGAFVDDNLMVNVKGLGLSPRAAQAMEPDQVIALALADQALSDSGDLLDSVPHDRVGVVIGKGGYVAPAGIRHTNHLRGARQLEASLRAIMPDMPQENLEALMRSFRDSNPVGDGSDAIGLVSNLAAARIAGHFDLRGGNWTTDAACASSLIALDTAMSQLALGTVDAMIVGGVHHCHDVAFWNVFCRMGAMSRSGRVRPFDADGDGLLISEGSAMLVIERLETALDAGRRIHAVIEGVGVSSDGTSGTPVRPGSPGQVLAMRRAWREAGVDPGDASFGLYEAHGTGTPVGDTTELTSLVELIGQKKHKVTISTAKGFIGHAMPAAGMAGLIRAICATRDGIRLPCVPPSSPLPQLTDGLEISPQPVPWDAPHDAPRRAGVSAFGFGGVNAHVVVSQPPSSGSPASASFLRTALRSRYALRLRARDRKEAAAELRRMGVAGAMSQPAGAVRGEGPVRVTLINPTQERIEMLIEQLEGSRVIWAVPGAGFIDPAALNGEGLTVGVCPGLEGGWADSRSDVVSSTSDDETYDWRAHARSVLQESTLAHQALHEVGVVCDEFMGASLGEINALRAAGAIHRTDDRPEVMDDLLSTISTPSNGYVLVVADRDRTLPLLEGLEHSGLSHDNGPSQCLIGGPDDELETVCERARSTGITARRLELRSAFHTQAIQPHVDVLRQALESLNWTKGTAPVWSSASAAQYDMDPVGLSEQAVAAIAEPVKFRETIEALYDHGARFFIQLGSGTSTSLIDSILGERPHLCTQIRPDLEHFALDSLWARELAWCMGREDVQDVLLTDTGRFSSGEGKSPTAFDVTLNLGTPLAQVPTLNEASRITTVQLEDSTPTPKPIPPSITISAETMPYLLDHCFYRQPPHWPDVEDRWPVVPGTTIVAFIQEVLENHYTGMVVTGFRNVRFLRWLPAEPRHDVPLQCSTQDDGWIAVRFGDYASASVKLAKQYPATHATAPDVPDSWKPCAISARDLYDKRFLFHGPSFQGLTSIGPFGPEGISGRIRPSRVPGAVLAGMGQVFGYWLIENQTENARMLPAAIGEIVFFTDIPTSGEDLDCHVSITGLEDDAVTADIVLSLQGEVICRAHGWVDRRFNTSPRTQAVEHWPEFHAFSRSLDGEWVFCAEPWSNLPSRQMMMRNYLGTPERRRYEALPPLRQRHWLLGRIAAKDAVRELLWKENPKPIFPAQITLLEGPDGAPEVRGRFGFDEVDGISVSIAHVPGLAVALARRGGVAPGIDIEACGPRSSQTREMGWTSAEQELIARTEAAFPNTDWWTVTWCAKEAVAKADRTGLHPSPRSFTVTRIDPHGRRLAVTSPNRSREETVIRWRNVTRPQVGAGEGPEIYVVAWTDSRL